MIQEVMVGISPFYLVMIKTFSNITNMVLVPKWLFRLFYLSGLALVLMCSFVIIQEFFRDPVNYECVLESGDGEEWNRKIKEEQEARRLEWAPLSQKEVAVELDHRHKKVIRVPWNWPWNTGRF